MSHQSNGPYAVSLIDEPHSQHDPVGFERNAPRPSLGPTRLSYGPYDHVQSSFFVPNHYEYQHGKSRKRSNLPKQSTEIMKTWFDQVNAIPEARVSPFLQLADILQNMTNPYPSEEQKAIFSSVSGVS